MFNYIWLSFFFFCFESARALFRLLLSALHLPPLSSSGKWCSSQFMALCSGFCSFSHSLLNIILSPWIPCSCNSLAAKLVPGFKLLSINNGSCSSLTHHYWAVPSILSQKTLKLHLLFGDLQSCFILLQAFVIFVSMNFSHDSFVLLKLFSYFFHFRHVLPQKKNGVVPTGTVKSLNLCTKETRVFIFKYNEKPNWIAKELRWCFSYHGIDK